MQRECGERTRWHPPYALHLPKDIEYGGSDRLPQPGEDVTDAALVGGVL
jgi:hypothetical protein